MHQVSRGLPTRVPTGKHSITRLTQVVEAKLQCVKRISTRDWKAHGHGLGIVSQANHGPLVDVRFADDILMFAFSVEQSMDMLRPLVGALQNVGHVLNVSKTKLLTTHAQPPEYAWLDLQTIIGGIRTSHKWLGCCLCLCLCLSRDQDADMEFHLSAAARAFWANKRL